MKNKIKASDLFVKMVLNSQYALASEDEQLISRLEENHGNTDDFTKKLIYDISMDNEYMRFSIIKTLIITLVDFGLVEKDVDLLDVKISNQLGLKAMEIHKSTRNNE